MQGFFLGGVVSGAVQIGQVTGHLPSGLNTAGLVDASGMPLAGVTCALSAAVDPATRSPLPGVLRYGCVVPGGPLRPWSGTLRLGGVPTDRQLKVCRFTLPESAAAPDVTPAQRHVQPYRDVAQSMDNQNYFIDASSSAHCPRIDGL